MSKSKDASSRLHEKHQNILADLLRDEDNKYCADCLAKGPRWASWNLGVFMCIRCAGIHRNLGVHISRVKSVNLDSWTPEQIESIQKGGNGRAKSVYEANLPANFRRPQDDYAVEQFIRAKYERKQYIAKGGSTEPVSKDTQDQKAKNKQKKTSSTSVAQKSSREQVISVPRPGGVKRSPSPQPPKPTSSSSSKPNLIAIDPGTSTATTTTAAKKSSPQPQIDILTGLSPAPPTVNNGPSSSSSQGVPPLMGAQAVGATPSSVPNQPSFGQPAMSAGMQPQQSQGAQGVSSSTKDSIMSLYSAQNQPQLSSYTAQGYPVNSLYYRQQQEAAMRMAHVAARQQHQVNQVTAQMQQIKVNQQQHQAPTMAPVSQPFPTGISNGGVGAGGQTLNPTLW